MPTQASPDRASESQSSAASTWQTLTTVSFTFICYLCIGIPLAVLPGFVHLDLGFNSILAGLAISVQYLATFLSRPHAGRAADSIGAKRTVVSGLYACLASGVLLLLAAFVGKDHAALCLGVLLLSRLALGTGESFTGTGAITWAIGKVGAKHTARVISWNGIATYGAIAIGAPLGVALEQNFGFASIAYVICALSLIGLLGAAFQAATPLVQGEQLAFGNVFWRVLPHGASLALASIGFGSIASFITLYYASRDWANAALSLTCFGVCFIGARLLFVDGIRRYGGLRVALVSTLVESVGLLLLWNATSAYEALIGASLTGCGFAMVFPALGVEAVGPIPPASRGAALGAYSLFLDVALGISGPLAGFIVEGFGYAQVFLFAAFAALVASALAATLHFRPRLSMK